MSKPKPRFQPGDRVMIYKPGADEHGATATVEKVIPGAEYDPADADGWAYVPTAPWRHRDGEYNSYHKGPLPDRMVTGAPAAESGPLAEGKETDR